jgi:hypothetical protein
VPYRSTLAASVLLVACAASGSSDDAQRETAPEVVRAQTAEETRFLPRGAVIESSGFATILQAPSPPFPDAPPPPENRPTNEAEWYAQAQGITVEEAVKRQREQAALRPQLERLLGLVRAKEPGNFTAVRMVHEPDWAYVFYQGGSRSIYAGRARYSGKALDRSVHGPSASRRARERPHVR